MCLKFCEESKYAKIYRMFYLNKQVALGISGSVTQKTQNVVETYLQLGERRRRRSCHTRLFLNYIAQRNPSSTVIAMILEKLLKFN